MPDRLPLRATLAALLLLIAIAGIGAVGPGIGRALPAHSAVLAIGCALEAVLACLLIPLRRPRTRTGASQAGAGAAEDLGTRLRRPLRAVILTFLVAIPLGLLL